MKLNSSILAYALSDFNPHLCGDTDQGLTLSDVRLLTNQTHLSSEKIYLCPWETLHHRSVPAGTIICLGGGDEACAFMAKWGVSGLVLACDNDVFTVLERIQDIFLHYNILEKELTGAIIREEPLSSLLNICAKFFENPVLIVDASLRLIASSDNYPYAETDNAWQEISSTGITSTSMMSELKRKGLASVLNSATKAIFPNIGSAYTRVISANCVYEGVRVASLSVSEADTPLSPLQLGLADYAVSMLAKEILKHHGSISHSRTQLRYCMEKMLQGERMDENIVYYNLSGINWKINDNFLLLRILLPRQAIESGTADHSKTVYESMFPHCITLDMNETFVMVWNEKNLENTTDKAISTLRKYLESDGAVCGMSLPFCDFMVLREQYQLAGAALELGKEGSSFCRYTEIMSEHLLSECARVLPFQALCHNKILRIHEYEKQAGGDLLYSLQMYLQHERSLKKASEELHIHRNSLVYRLDRISKIVDLPLDDAQSRMHLLLSCIMVRYLDKLNSELLKTH